MIYTILQIITFQFLFLVLYDVLHRKETFFQYNRAYLLITSCLAIWLPFIKLRSLANAIPQEYAISLPEAVSGTAQNIASATPASSFFSYFSWQEWVFILGLVCSLLWFSIKLYALLNLKLKAKVETKAAYTKVIVKNSNAAFSFFNTIFLGDAIAVQDHDAIIKHELVHVRQKHSLDMLYFELLRIVFWFNPLVYIYQKRIAEVHEFIADAEAAGENKKEQYHLLLSLAFKTRDISFVNQFIKKSLLKNRIIMLQKSKSRKISQFKYLLLLPVLLSMLVYASCDRESTEEPLSDIQIENGSVTVEVKDVNNLSKEEMDKLSVLWSVLLNEKANTKSVSVKLTDGQQTSYINMDNNTMSENGKGEEVEIAQNYRVKAQSPVFPGCENSEDQARCFNEKLQNHILQKLKYPEEAKKLGIQGKVYVMFNVSEDGNITNIKTKGPHKTLEAEARRIIALLPKMQAAKDKEGKAISLPISVPIKFTMGN